MSAQPSEAVALHPSGRRRGGGRPGVPVDLAHVGAVLAELVPDGAAPLEDASLDVPFADLGYDSLLLMAARRRLGRELGLAIPPAALLDAATPRMLLDVLAACPPAAAAVPAP
ncbi:MAG: acyl carrier protein [Kineosporiaceae bacterium]